LINIKKNIFTLSWQAFCKVSRTDRLASYEKPNIRGQACPFLDPLIETYYLGGIDFPPFYVMKRQGKRFAHRGCPQGVPSDQKKTKMNG
jgi:hypothetical protein